MVKWRTDRNIAMYWSSADDHVMYFTSGQVEVYTVYLVGLCIHPSDCDSAVRKIVVDSRQLASLGTEERPVTQGGSVLGPDQRSLIARCTFTITPCDINFQISNLYCHGSNAVVSRLVQLRQHGLDAIIDIDFWQAFFL